MTATVRRSESKAAPANRASWCGQLRIGDLCVPVKAYSAIATPPETPLRQLHTGCGQRIEYDQECRRVAARFDEAVHPAELAFLAELNGLVEFFQRFRNRPLQQIL
jgi:hypothetical protein